MIEPLGNHYLMRRLVYTPSSVRIYCDIRIPWLRDIYFRSLYLLPQSTLCEKPFSLFKTSEEYVEIDLAEWSSCIASIASGLRDNDLVRIRLRNNVNLRLSNYNRLLTRVEKFGFQSPAVFADLLEHMAQADAFAIFNMLLPLDYYSDILLDICDDGEILLAEDALICPFYPHRVMVRREKLKLALDVTNRAAPDDQQYQEYLRRFGVYEGYEEWIFDYSRLSNITYVKRDVDFILKSLSSDEIAKEIMLIDSNRDRQASRFIRFLDKIEELSLKHPTYRKKNLVDMFSFLSLVVAEEEKRHMLECRHFALLGPVFSKLDIDPARINLDELLAHQASLSNIISEPFHD